MQWYDIYIRRLGFIVRRIAFVQAENADAALRTFKLLPSPTPTNGPFIVAIHTDPLASGAK